jgi:hypothetical protein
MVKSKHMMPEEVLIYIQNLKRYINSNEEASKYFIMLNKKDEFFEFAIELSQKNFETTGEPELTIEQFEEIRQKLYPLPGKDVMAFGVFISLKDFGTYSLN